MQMLDIGPVVIAGKQRRWDMISSHSSVGVIIYHTELDALLVVRQFRPPVSHSSSLHATACHVSPVFRFGKSTLFMLSELHEMVLLHFAVSLTLPTRTVQAYATAMKQTEEEGHPAPPLSVGFTYELCAGIVDKNQSLEQIAAEEVCAVCLTKASASTKRYASVAQCLLQASRHPTRVTQLYH